MKNIIENNKIIAEFLNLTSQVIFEQVFAVSENGKTNFYKKDELKFNSDWNWLIEVVEKIERLENNLKNETREEFTQFQKVLSLPIYTKIEAVYNACVEFIKWYNENK